MTKMSATDVSRNFSEVSNRIADGEEITVVRAGRPSFVMKRLEDEPREWISGREFLERLSKIPPLDDDFAADVEAAREEMNSRPERSTPLEWD